MVKRFLMVAFLSFGFWTWLVGCQPRETLTISDDTPVGTIVVTTSPTPGPTKTLLPAPTVIDSMGENTAAGESSEMTDVVESLAAELDGLDLDEFFEASIRALTLRSPESVVSMGLTDIYGVKEVLLDDISDSYQRETYQMFQRILEMLKRYEDDLSPEERISYDVYRWYLEDQVAEQAFMYHNYPATYYGITAVQEDTLWFFTDIHPIRDIQDARDYVTRLGLVKTKIDQLIDNLELRAQTGIIPPEFAIQWAVYGSLGHFIDTAAQDTALYTVLQENMQLLSSGTPEEMEALLVEAEETIENQILPAYQDLYDTLIKMETYSGGDGGVWRLPKGDKYYANRLVHFTTTDLSAEEIHQIGLQELERIHNEMRQIFQQLGYDKELTIVEGYNQVAQDGGHVAGKDVLRRYEDIILAADQNLDAAFDLRPTSEVIVVQDEYGDFYIRPAVDGSRPGAFYAGVGGSGKEAYAMPTLAYHETIPGHHFQIALALEMENMPSFRQGLTFTAFTEGWALYAERLAWELGWYDDDPYGYLGFLQSQAFRAARLVVDTGLHAKGWTFDQAEDFFTDNTGFTRNDNVNPQHEIARYLVWPGQSTSYYVGYLEIMAQRERAKAALGDLFDLKEFHRVVLTNGSLPLQVLDSVVEGWLNTRLAE